MANAILEDLRNCYTIKTICHNRRLPHELVLLVSSSLTMDDLLNVVNVNHNFYAMFRGALDDRRELIEKYRHLVIEHNCLGPIESIHTYVGHAVNVLHAILSNPLVSECVQTLSIPDVRTQFERSEIETMETVKLSIVFSADCLIRKTCRWRCIRPPPRMFACGCSTTRFRCPNMNACSRYSCYYHRS